DDRAALAPELDVDARHGRVVEDEVVGLGGADRERLFAGGERGAAIRSVDDGHADALHGQRGTRSLARRVAHGSMGTTRRAGRAPMRTVRRIAPPLSGASP